MLKLNADDLAQTAERILQVDKQRLMSDLFKLPDWLRLLVETRLMAYRMATREHSTASGSRSNQSEQVKTSITRLTQRMRDGHKFLSGLPDFRVDVLAGVNDNPDTDVMRTYEFRLKDVASEMSTTGKPSAVISRLFVNGDIYQGPEDESPAGKSPFALFTMTAKTSLDAP